MTKKPAAEIARELVARHAPADADPEVVERFAAEVASLVQEDGAITAETVREIVIRCDPGGGEESQPFIDDEYGFYAGMSPILAASSRLRDREDEARLSAREAVLRLSDHLSKARDQAHALADALDAARHHVALRARADRLADRNDSRGNHARITDGVRTYQMDLDAVAAHADAVEDELVKAQGIARHDVDGVLADAIEEILTSQTANRHRAATTEGQFGGGSVDDAFSLALDLDRASKNLSWSADVFTGADLREVDLSKVALEGVLWDMETQWPEGWKERIKRASDLLPRMSGVYVVRTVVVKA
ncbi:hypothetical protein [Streptomyces sp. NBC_00005]|uniref:hypothetical protein n=1 Tax=Streptomyces sp. NBC_00005 TaxID=2903609 RepID=UPI00324CACB1